MPLAPCLLRSPSGPPVPDVRRIAVLRANGIGDFVVALPALAALRAAYPEAEITYLGVDWHPALLGSRPGPWDRVLVVPPCPGVREGEPAPPQVVGAFLADRRAERYDLALQLHGGGAHSNPFVAALGARVTVGSADRGAAPLDRTTTYAYYQHEVLRFLEVVALVGAPPVELEPRLAVTAADLAAADTELADTELADTADSGVRSGPWVALHPGASDARRRWPAASFAVVADRLAAAGARVVVIGSGADDARAAAAIRAAADQPPVDLVGRLSLPGTVGLLRRCRLVVANDSGPRHLAAAVGTATVGIYWCGNVITAGPLTRARHRIGVSFRVDCPVCGAVQSHGRCPHNPSFVADVPPGEIVEHALELYTDAAGRDGPAVPSGGRGEGRW